MKILRENKAFTIIELLIALSLTLMIGAITSKMLLQGLRTAGRVTEEVYNLKTSRTVLRYITKDIMAAEKITEPSNAGDSSNRLVINGLARKDVAMTLNGTIYEPESSQGAWTEGKPVIVYVDTDGDGEGEVRESGYTVNYASGQITFNPNPAPADPVTADFTQDTNITYTLDTTTNNLSRNNQVLARDLQSNPPVFERMAVDAADDESMRMFRITLTYENESISSTIDGASGTYLIDRSIANGPNFNSTYFLSGNNGWAVGDGGTIYQYNGAWAEFPSGITNDLNAISFGDRSTGYIVGDPGVIFRYNNDTWITETSDINDNLVSIWANDDDKSFLASRGTEGFIGKYEDPNNWVRWPGTENADYPNFNSVTGNLYTKLAVTDGGNIYTFTDRAVGRASQQSSLRSQGGPSEFLIDLHFGLCVDEDFIHTFALDIWRQSCCADIIGATVHRYPKNPLSASTGNTTFGSFYNIAGGSSKVVFQGLFYYEGYDNRIYRRPMPGSQTELIQGISINDFDVDKTNISIFVADLGDPSVKRFSITGTEQNSYFINNPVKVTADAGIAFVYSPGIIRKIVVSSGQITNRAITYDVANIGYNNQSQTLAITDRTSNSVILMDADMNEIDVIEDGFDFTIPGGDVEVGDDGSVYVTFYGPRVSRPSNPSSWDQNYYIRQYNPGWNRVFGPYGQDFNSISGTGDDDAGENFWVVGQQGSIISYNKSSNEWSDQSDTNSQPAGSRANLNSVHFFDENTGWAVGEGGTVLKYDSALNQWLEIPSGTTENLNGVFMYSRDEGYIVGDNGTLLQIESVKR